MKTFFPLWLSVSLLLLTSLSLPAQRGPVRTIGAEDKQCFDAIDWQWVPLGRGAEAGCAQVRLFDSMQSISIVRYPMRRFRSDVYVAENEAAAATSVLASQVSALSAVNGSYFKRGPRTGTYLKDGGNVIGTTSDAETFRCNGMVAFRRKGRKVEVFTCVNPSAYDYATRRASDAIVSGPILTEKGRIVRYGDSLAVYQETVSRLAEGTWRREDAMRAVPRSSWVNFYDWRHPRSMLGTTRDGMVYLVVVDGRFPGEADGMTILEMSYLAHWLGLSDAINLDGGGSSTLWSGETGVLNHPCDNRSFDHEGERRVPNIVYAY